MKKIVAILKRYIVISLILSLLAIIWMLGDMIYTHTLPIANFVYVIRLVFSYIVIAAALIIPIAFIDLLIIQSVKALFNDYIKSDFSGRVIIIIAVIIVLLRKIFYWTR